jgi:uncharacterized Ntn-hydrolase superfamily protein
MTLSLAGRCDQTGLLGGIISSSSIAVAARCLWTSSHGVVLTQNVTDPHLGVIGLEWLAKEYSAAEVLARLLDSAAHKEWRQLAILDSKGQGKTFTGARGLGITAEALGTDCVAAGNLLANEGVPHAMTRAFVASASRPLAERLLLALETGIQAGGEMGPVHSAGLQVSQKPLDWPAINLRVDWSDNPTAELRTLWRRYEPQMHDYILRSARPDQAPAYGVPGDP